MSECPKCKGTGLADSGGVQPWGEPILIECDCKFEEAIVEQMRSDFEAWFDKEYKHLESSKYIDLVPHIKYGFWMAWEASRAAVEIELPDMNSKRYVEHGNDFDFLQYRMDLEDAIRAAGLTVKGDR